MRAHAEQKPPKPTEYSTEFTVKLRYRKTLRTKLDVVRAAAVDKSVCHVAQPDPRTVSLIGMRQGSTPVTFWFRAGSHRPVTCLVRVVPGYSVPQLAFRVKVAEVEPALLPSSRGPAVEAILQAEAGTNPVVLTEEDARAVELALRHLKEQHALRVLSERRLTATDGQPAVLVVGDERSKLAAGNPEGGAAADSGYRAAFTLLPRVSDQGDIRLELTSQFRHPQATSPESPAGGNMAQATTTSVHLREGETLVIGSRLEEPASDEAKGVIPMLLRSVGRSPARSEHTKLLVFVTPELIRPAGSARTSSLASFEGTELRKDESALKR